MGMDIKNKKAYFEYEILEKFVAGMQLMGSEVKSIREGKANIQESFCYFKKMSFGYVGCTSLSTNRQRIMDIKLCVSVSFYFLKESLKSYRIRPKKRG